MVITQDLEMCYPTEYYTHVPVSSDTQMTTRTSNGRARGLARLRDEVRSLVKASVMNIEKNGMRKIVGRGLASFRPLRERAFFGLSDELIPGASEMTRALEVGCGTGFLMRELKNAGWLVEGIEWDPAACEVARVNTGAVVRLGDFRELDLPLGAYGLVVLRHVFEHLNDPLAALKRVGDLLAPGGRGVLFYPNPESLGARIFRSQWYYWDPPRHLVFVSANSLGQLAERAGLFTVSIRTTARFASHVVAGSRSIRNTNSVDLSTLRESIQDDLFARIESSLTALGARVGEEIVAVVTRPRDHE